MFLDYESLVVADYHQKMTLNALSPRLIDPTPAKLRDECISIFGQRHDRKDERTLRVFFETKEDVILSERLIEKFDIAKFKPLVNYLKNGTGSTERKNIELLAWLINFEPRPFEYGRKYQPVTKAVSIVGREETNTNDGSVKEATTTGQSIVEQTGNKPSLSKKPYGKPYFSIKTIIVLASLIIAAIVVGLYYEVSDSENPRTYLSGLERCMYWTGDQYEQVSCNQKLGDTLVIAFDSIRFHKLKRITRPDTITLKAIGKVWYIKRKNQYEFFTWGGYYPADPKFRLRLASEHIIENRITNVGSAE